MDPWLLRLFWLLAGLVNYETKTETKADTTLCLRPTDYPHADSTGRTVAGPDDRAGGSD